MLKNTGFRVLCLAAMVSFLFVAQTRAEEQGWKKTLTLPGGEVVCDLNGEWDLSWVGRGEAQPVGRLSDVVKITQQGNSFEGIRMVGNVGNWGHQWGTKGEKAIEGELDKNGLMNLIYYQGGSWLRSDKGKISKDGNVIEFMNKYGFIELTRK